MGRGGEDKERGRRTREGEGRKVKTLPIRAYAPDIC